MKIHEILAALDRALENILAVSEAMTERQCGRLERALALRCALRSGGCSFGFRRQAIKNLRALAPSVL